MQTSSENTSIPSFADRPAAAGAQPPTPPAGEPAERAPRVLSVMCPAGFTAYAAEGYDLSKPLFARVTYRAD